MVALMVALLAAVAIATVVILRARKATDDGNAGSTTSDDAARSTTHDAGAQSTPTQMRVHLIDVGQGAATLLEFSCAAVLVDTGGERNDEFDSTEHLLAYLDRFFARRPDLHRTLALLIITHPHIDHTRGGPAVWERFHVLNLVTNGTVVSSGRKQMEALLRSAAGADVHVEAIRAIDVPTGGMHDQIIDPVACRDADPDIRVLWGALDGLNLRWPLRRLNEANNASVVTKVTLGKASFLITGDLEQDGIAELLRRQAGTDALHADVYEVGHHASNNGTTTALLDAILPKIALVAVGGVERHGIWTAWTYGHPRKSTIEMLEQKLSGKRRTPRVVSVGIEPRAFEQHEVSAPIYATGWDGNIVVTMYATGELDVATGQ